MSDQGKRNWFSAKRFGWGWGPPTTWEGWLVLVVWFAVLIPTSYWLAPRNMPLFLTFTAVMVGAIVAICYAKGEPPHWSPLPKQFSLRTLVIITTIVSLALGLTFYAVRG
jgi:hypothetical protein